VFFTAEISQRVIGEVLEIGVRSVITKGGGGYLHLLSWIEKLAHAQNSKSVRARKVSAKKIARRRAS
jgi:hypothetical protein